MEDIQQEEKRSSMIVEVLKFTILALLIVTPFRFFIAQPFIVSGASMIPTFHPREYLVVDELSYRLDNPVRGDVIIFRYPLDPDVFFIKRVVGLPGETIEIRNGDVSVRGVEEKESHPLQEPYLTENVRRRENSVTVLGEDEYFVMGDNRDASSDSRVWGPLREKYIVGKAFARLFPVGEIEILPGQYRY